MGRKDISTTERWFKTNKRGIGQVIGVFLFFLVLLRVFESPEDSTLVSTDESPNAKVEDDLGFDSIGKKAVWDSSAVLEPIERTEDHKTEDTVEDTIVDTKSESDKDFLVTEPEISEEDSSKTTPEEIVVTDEESQIEVEIEPRVSSGEEKSFWPLPARISPKNPGTFVNFRTKACSYFCELVKKSGMKESFTNPYRLPPELLLIDYRKYTKYSSLKRTVINQVGRGSSCIGGGKGKQLRCREDLAKASGCEFSQLSVQPPQWNIQQPSTCAQFMAHAELPENSKKIWIAKPGGSFHGRGITIHDSTNSIRKKFGNCQRALGDGVIIQEYIKDPALMGENKFDLRSYLLIASTDPFIVFYHDGFIRKAQTKYSTSAESLKDPLAHVTNSIGQSSENHFFNFDQLQDVLTRQHGFPSDYMQKTFRPHAMRVTNFLFQTSFNKTRGLIPTPGRFQVFALDWMIDRQGGIYLLEANGNPLVAHYEGTKLTPVLWNSLLKLEKMLHISPEELTEPLSVAQGFRYKGWRLVYNQVEVEAKKENFEACRYDEYITNKHPLYSYEQYGN